MAYGAAGRWARIHDIYISVILKPFLGNRIECELTFPFHAPFFLLVARPSVSASRSAVPMGREDRIHDQATDRAHDHAFDRSVHLAVAPSRPSHPFISSARRASARLVPSFRHLVACPRPVPLPAVSTSRAGRGASSRVAVLPPHVRRFISFRLVRCRWTS